MHEFDSKQPVPETLIGPLLMRHRRALFGYIFSCVPHAADAEDILQEVCLTATRRIDQLRDEAGFLPWVIEIARRQILAHRRQASRQMILDPQVVSALADDALAVARADAATGRAEALLKCLDELPAQSAALMRARYSEAFTSIADLAKQSQRTISATYALIKRIRVALRECVARRLAAEGAR